MPMLWMRTQPYRPSNAAQLIHKHGSCDKSSEISSEVVALRANRHCLLLKRDASQVTSVSVSFPHVNNPAIPMWRNLVKRNHQYILGSNTYLRIILKYYKKLIFSPRPHTTPASNKSKIIWRLDNALQEKYCFSFFPSRICRTLFPKDGVH